MNLSPPGVRIDGFSRASRSTRVPRLRSESEYVPESTSFGSWRLRVRIPPGAPLHHTRRQNSKPKGGDNYGYYSRGTQRGADRPGGRRPARSVRRRRASAGCGSTAHSNGSSRRSSAGCGSTAHSSGSSRGSSLGGASGRSSGSSRRSSAGRSSRCSSGSSRSSSRGGASQSSRCPSGSSRLARTGPSPDHRTRNVNTMMPWTMKPWKPMPWKRCPGEECAPLARWTPLAGDTASAAHRSTAANGT